MHFSACKDKSQASLPQRPTRNWNYFLNLRYFTLKCVGKSAVGVGCKEKNPATDGWVKAKRNTVALRLQEGMCVRHTHTHTPRVCFTWFVYLPPNSTSLRPLWSEHWTCPALPKWDRQPCDPLNNLCLWGCTRALTHVHSHTLTPVCQCSCRPI